MGPMCCPETSVLNYQSTLRKIPEGCRSHLHRGGGLKSRRIRSLLLLFQSLSVSLSVCLYVCIGACPYCLYSVWWPHTLRFFSSVGLRCLSSHSLQILLIISVGEDRRSRWPRSWTSSFYESPRRINESDFYEESLCSKALFRSVYRPLYCLVFVEKLGVPECPKIVYRS
jgi:hypothetical protein